MNRINFSQHILPHLIALCSFVLITLFFFSPATLNKKSLVQGDIQQWEGSSKSVRDFRDQTGEEPLWANSMFSGMPAYLINVHWSNKQVSYLKTILSFNFSHPICNVYLAFVSYYILLLTFGIRPYLAITGAIAFGLSSYMIIGLVAGHNNRIGAIAFMPLVMAGIHLGFNKNLLMGFALTMAGVALHLRENHLQITYYLLIIVAAYIAMTFIDKKVQKNLGNFYRSLGVLVLAAIVGACTYFGPFWAISEYSKYSSRGKSELVPNGKSNSAAESAREYAFNNSYGVLEPLTLIIPNFYGGSSSTYLVQDESSKSYRALAGTQNNDMINKLAEYTSAYWGPQRPFGASPYYAGAIIIFLFAIGIAMADKKYVWWLLSIVTFSLLLTLGNNFSSFNYFLFDYLPGYNKFRSVSFSIIMALFAFPLLGFLGLEKLLKNALTKTTRRQLLLAFGFTGGISLLLVVFAGVFPFLKEGESSLPAWFLKALVEDRRALLRGDAFRSAIFILLAFFPLYFSIWKMVPSTVFFAFLAIIVLFDLVPIDKRFIADENYVRGKRGTMPLSESSEEILKDKTYYRVFNLLGTMTEANTSYYHHSIGGYHGAKLKRYQDLFDSCVTDETIALIQDLRTGLPKFDQYKILNMLNAKYFVYGPQIDNIILNPNANGPAWFVKRIEGASSPTDELEKVCNINTADEATVDLSKFKLEKRAFDSIGRISLLTHHPNYLKYESESTSDGFAVFSEIFYPKGWNALIDGNDIEILRANYVLRALNIPAGKHSIEFMFRPDAYYIGNKITAVSSWIMLILILGVLGLEFKRQFFDPIDRP